MTALMYNIRALHEYVISVGPAVGSVEQIVNYNTSANIPAAITQHSPIPSVIFDIVLLFFALQAFLKHVSEAKRLDGRWSINMLVRTLMADHLVYFVCYLTWMSISLAANYINYDLTVSSSNILLDDVIGIFGALAIIAGPRMVISLRAQESRPRGLEGTSMGELSSVQFGIRDLPTQSESVIEEVGG
ncbi:hypothetical protein BJ138DRAFT_1192402 [Hygrophoropsis aurantiaca]|uniref:Uncharacterized protein n=1 Tax=Hygrophoropsis aurantiaca TaxID=72124 RepID=A0ACB7ZS91_9AGAM|nr:hypothetical protein BJ138DRAFT_1192402 [Hygrophoropsis aurantiaca]